MNKNNNQKGTRSSNWLIEIICVCITVAAGRAVFTTHSILMSACLGAVSGAIGIVIGMAVSSLINKHR